MARPALIGITGRARSGKDTTADFIIAHLGGYKYSLAEPLKNMLKHGLGLDMTDPYWAERKEDPIPALGKSPRQIMQTLGTEWGRQLVHPDIWIIMAHNMLLSRGAGMVIPDVRFQNEADWIRKHGVLLHIVRPGIAGVAAHASENGLLMTEDEVVINNNSSLEDLQNEVHACLESLKISSSTLSTNT